MDSKHTYTVEKVLEIINSMDVKDKESVKTILLLGEAEFERLIKMDFDKYGNTIPTLA